MAEPWDSHLSASDREIYEITGYGAGPGWPERPALLVIDVTLDFCGPEGASGAEAARQTRTACGPRAWAAVPKIATVIAAARAAERPVIYTRRSEARLAKRRAMNARSGEDRAEGNEIVAPLAPQPGDLVIGKSKPSAFWRTGLVEKLTEMGCDGVILTGGTTSGCVRASAVDAFNHDIPAILVADAVFDRFEASHAMSLFDLQAKYAGLCTAAEAEEHLRAM